MMSNEQLFFLAGGGFLLLAVVIFAACSGSSGRNLSNGRDVWQEFVSSLKLLPQKKKKVCLVVMPKKKKSGQNNSAILENIDKMFVPAFINSLFAATGIAPGETDVEQAGINLAKYPKDCHVLVLINVGIVNNQYEITLNYYRTDIVGTPKKLDFRPDVAQVISDDIKRREAFKDDFQKRFPSFVAAVARKM